MNATILHESKGRIRFRINQKQMTLRQADLLELWFQEKSWVQHVTVHERTCCVILHYCDSREKVIAAIRCFSWKEAEDTVVLPVHSSRELNRCFTEKLIGKIILKAAYRLFLPPPLRIARVIWQMIPFLKRGLCCLIKGQLKVEVLDAISIGISVLRGDFATAGSVMFLLELGELLEEWTHKKTVEDLAKCMSLNVDRAWVRTAAGEVIVPVAQIQPGDLVVMRAGSIIPTDGVVTEGYAAVNQASLTGESVPMEKKPDSLVYAGTVVEEGECVFRVTQTLGQSRYNQIVSMIERSEQLKSTTESTAAALADNLVPYTFMASLAS